MADLTPLLRASIEHENAKRLPDEFERERLAELEADTLALPIADVSHSPAEARLYRYLRHRSQLVAEQELVKASLSAWLKSLQSKVDGLDYIFMAEASAMVRTMLRGKAKSVNTPWGRCGFRTAPGGLDVDDEAEVLAAVARGELPMEVRRETVTVAKSVLNELHKQTGEVLPGCAVREAEERFYLL